MTDAPETLAGFLAQDTASFAAQDTDPQAEAEMREELRAADPGVLKAFTMGAILGALYTALDIPFTEVLRAAWESARDLQDYRDTEKHPPDQVKWVAFGKHKLTSTHAPKVEVLVGGGRVATITFKLDLVLKVASTKLRIQGGRIHEATGAEFEGECKLSYRGFTLLKKPVAKFALPGSVGFEGGIPILPLPA